MEIATAHPVGITADGVYDTPALKQAEEEKENLKKENIYK